MRNVYACLVHERQESVLDLVRNLNYLDPASTILLYNGGSDPDLLRRRFTRNGSEPLVHPNPRTLEWGALHAFALDCIRYALETVPFDTLTIVDSDQLGTRPGYTQHVAAFLSARPSVGMLGSAAGRQALPHARGPAVAALRELDLWRPLLDQFDDAEEKFPFWTFWPGTVFTAAAARDLLSFFDGDQVLPQILDRTRVWATEEVLLPSLVALLGHEIAVNPCSQSFVRYRAAYTKPQVEVALRDPNVFWVHPIDRRYDDPLRALIRACCNHYHRPRARDEGGTMTEAPTLLLPTRLLGLMHGIDGWLSDEEAEVLIAAAVHRLTAAPDGGDIVEIGSYCGRSTVVLAGVVQALAGRGRVYAIDPHDGVVGALDAGIHHYAPTLARFRQNIAQAGLDDLVISVCQRPHETTWSKPVSLLFVDGLHDYANVSRDFYHFEPWLAEGAMVAFHDYADYFPGVKTFVDELLADGAYTLTHLAGSMALLLRLGKGRSRHATRSAEGAGAHGHSSNGHAGTPSGERRTSSSGAGALATITCLMPTYGRPDLAARAIACFMRQDHPRAELVVIDDGPESLAELMPDDSRVRHLRLETRRSIGAKRNLGAEAGRGELLANWDDDDWYAPWRLAYQAEQLQAGAAEVCGLDRLLYFQPATGQAWRYTPPPGMRAWLADPTLLFTRELWARNPFPDTSHGIDCDFLWRGQPKRMLALHRGDFFVGMIHPGNTSRKHTEASVWHPEELGAIRALLREDSDAYGASGHATAAVGSSAAV